MADEVFYNEDDDTIFAGGRAAPPGADHHIAWNHALDHAVAQAAEKMSPGEKRSFEVEFIVDVIRTNPGWIDGYKVNLKDHP